MNDSHETEIALIKQFQTQLAAKIDEVDANCDKRSDHTDAKLDELMHWLIVSMGGMLVTLIIYVVTHIS